MQKPVEIRPKLSHMISIPWPTPHFNYSFFFLFLFQLQSHTHPLNSGTGEINDTSSTLLWSEILRAGASLQEQLPLSTKVLMRYLTLRFPLLHVVFLGLAVLLDLVWVVVWPLSTFVSKLSALVALISGGGHCC